MAKMAKWSPKQWSWDEGKIRKALKGFRTYLKSDKGKRQIYEHERRKKQAQKFLKDRTTINRLTKKQLVELLKDADAYVINRRAVKEIKHKANYIKKVKDWLKRLISYNQGSLPTMKHLGVGYASELLTMRFPDRFYLLNKASRNGIKKLGQGKLPTDYSKWRPLFEYLRGQIEPIVQQELGRPADFYDVDLFLWYVYEERHFSEPIQDTLLLVRYFEAKGFRFTKEQVAAFYAALKTKGFVVLSGLSGTGKTKLAQLFAELLCPCEKCRKGEGHNVCDKCTHLFLSVRPDWRDSKALLGYYNPLTERYESTPLREFLLRAAKDYKQNEGKAQPYFVILDEMNLAHVEYYFADFLSVLESGRVEKGWTKESLRLERIGNLPLPPNLYIIGTVNIDETTYMFSPKVLDRAFTLEFREVDFSDYLGEGVNEEEARKIAEEIRGKILEDLRNGGKFCAVVASKKEISQALEALKKLKTAGDARNVKEALNNLNRTLQPYDLHFGYRVLDEIALFVQNATKVPDDVGKLDEKEEMAKDKALDYAVLMKVLPKFHGPRQKLEIPLWQVLNWCLEEGVSDGSVSPQKVWKQITGEEKQPSGDDITAQLRDWNSIVGKFRYPNTAKKVLQMLRQLYETGFASFAQ